MFTAVETVYDLLNLAEVLWCSDSKNYIAKIKPLNTHINVSRMRELAEGYYDTQALDLLEFGFPLDICMADFTPNTQVKNHPSASNFIDDVHKYIREEIEHGVILGPYNLNDFDKVHVSPLMSRPKDTNKQGLLLIYRIHMSIYGSSVNSVTSAEAYLGVNYCLKLPTVDTICAEISNRNNDVKLYKINLARAFRQIKIPLIYLT
jgi:hypothetical protein